MSPGRPLAARRLALGAVLLAAALLAVPLMTPAVPAASEGAAGRIWGYLHIDSDLAKPNRAFEAFDASDMNLYDINGDGMPELISLNDNNNAYVIDPREGTVLAEISPYFPGGGAAWPARSMNGISVGDVNGNGRTDLVIATASSHLGVWEFQPEGSTASKFNFKRLWETFVTPKHNGTTPWMPAPDSYPPPKDYPGLDGNPSIGSVRNDGKQWIFVQNDDLPGIYAYDHTGATMWKRTDLDGNAGPVVADLNGDGKREVVFVSDGGAVMVYDAETGQRKWQWWASAHGANPGSISVSPTVTDLDGDGKMEIFVGARQAVQSSDPDWMSKQNAKYFLIDHTGTLKWKTSFTWGTPHIYMHAVTVDINKDGTKDIVAVDWNTIGHKPGNWEKLGGGNLFAIDGRTGKDLWHVGLDSTWSNKDIAIADVTGDGNADILVPTQGAWGRDGIGLYSLQGQEVGWFGITDGWQISRGPVVADLWGDGKLAILLPVYRNGGSHCVHQLDVGCREGAIEVWITGSGGVVMDANNDLYNADNDNPATAAKNPRAKPSGQKSPEPKSFEEWTGNGKDSDGNSGGGDAPGSGLGVPGPGVAAALLAALGAAYLVRDTRRRRG